MVEWTDEMIERFKAMWNERRPKGDIAKAFGVTKNAVTGKAYRLGLRRERKSPVQSPKTIERQSKRRAADVAKTVPIVSKKETTPASVSPTNAPKPPSAIPMRGETVPMRVKLWTERGSNECAYPVGTPPYPAAQKCCGNRTRPGEPYCREHRKFMFETPAYRGKPKPFMTKFGS